MRMSTFLASLLFGATSMIGVLSAIIVTPLAHAQPQAQTPASQSKTDSTATNAAIGEAIDKASRGRMVAQRLVKLHAQIALGVNSSRSLSTMMEVISGFEANLAELENYVTTVSSINRTRQLTAAWQTFKASVLATPANTKLKQLAADADTFTEITDNLVQSYQAQSKSVSSTIINQCGRQRLISQRLAALFMLEEAAQITPLQAAEQAKLRNEFASTLASLTAASVNTPEIKAELKLAEQQWVFFQSALTGKHGVEGARHVASTSERILEVLNNSTNMYQRLAASGIKVAAL